MIKPRIKKYPLEVKVDNPHKRNTDKKYAYIKLKLPVSKITEDYEDKLKKKLIDYQGNPKIAVATRNDAKRLVTLYNRSFLTAGVPFRTMTEEIFLQLYNDYKCDILIARRYGMDAGFMIIDFDGENREYGIISGLGILPRFQRRGIATALALEAWKRFLQNHVEEIRCEVFYSNKTSLSFIKSLGFKEYDLIVFLLEVL